MKVATCLMRNESPRPIGCSNLVGRSSARWVREVLPRRQGLECLAMMRETPATRWNLEYIEAAYRKWQQDPASVDESWRFFFEGFELGANRLATPALDARRQTGIDLLIHAYRDLGHFVAHLD